MRWTTYLFFLTLYYSCEYSSAQSDVIYMLESVEEEDSLDFDLVLDLLNYCGSLEDEILSERDSLKAVNQDLKFIEKIVNRISSFDEVNEFINATKASLREDSIGLRNELDYTAYEIHGSSHFYIKCHLISFDNLILSNYIEFHTDKKLIEIYAGATEVELYCDYGKVWGAYWKKSNLNIYKKKYPKSYWLIPFKNYRDRRYEAIDYFSYLPAFENDIIDQYRVDYQYLRKAMDHMRYLLVQKDTVALENLLFSPFPTGRDMAAGGLNYLEENTEYQPTLEIATQIDEVKRDSTIFKIGIDASHWGTFAPRVSIFREFDSFLRGY